MYIAQPQVKPKCGMCRKKRVNDIGLGAEGDGAMSNKDAQANYGGMNENASTVAIGVKLAATVALMAIPVVGWAAALLINIPVIGDTIMSPVMKPLMKSMKKATHMESCMKWWTDSNIRGMISDMAPWPIGDDVKREYRLQRGTDMAVNESGRRENMVSRFVASVRANPNLMEAQCASMPQGEAETHAGISPVTVASYFSQLKQQAQYDEYMEIAGGYAITAGEKTQATQQSRAAAVTFQLPTGVTSINKGAMVLTPGVSSNKVIDMFPTKR